ncbi:MAG TPA: flavodoxin family protein [Desulfobacterales bacterium]|nr:flavodoxin family protein [Desulfobacterales bacterium]
MNILCLLGSPRPDGNSAAIARRFLKTAEKLGAKARVFELNNLNYTGCQACWACKTNLDRCILEDDLKEVLESLWAADVLVLATPVYFGDVSAQMKAFIDRTFCYFVPDYAKNPNRSRLAPGKKLVFIIAQGHPDETRFAGIFSRYEYFFKWHGFEDTYLIRACGIYHPGDAKKRKDIMKLAEDTANKIFS